MLESTPLRAIQAASKSKRVAIGKLAQGIERLVALQEQLYAQDRWAVLLIFQAMDAAGDLDERDRRDDYMDAYEQALSKTSTKHAPWFIVPADHKWFTRLAIAELVLEALERLDLAFPKLSKAQREALHDARKRLEDEP